MPSVSKHKNIPEGSIVWKLVTPTASFLLQFLLFVLKYIIVLNIYSLIFDSAKRTERDTMKASADVGFFTGLRLFLGIRTKEEKAFRKQFLERQRQELEQARLLPELREKYMQYPVMKLSKEEFSNIPRAEQLPDGFLETCPIGTFFVCREKCPALEIIVIGQIVKEDDLICEQYGAGMSVPARGANRYRLELSD